MDEMIDWGGGVGGDPLTESEGGHDANIQVWNSRADGMSPVGYPR